MNEQSLIFGGVALVKCRVKGGPAMVSVSSVLNPILREAGWLSDAPFKTVHLIFRYGEAKQETFFQSINRKYSELPIAREISAVELQAAMRAGNMEQIFMREALVALADVASRFNLPMKWLSIITEKNS